MKKTLLYFAASLTAFLIVGTAHAQMMGNGYGMPYGNDQGTASSASASQDPAIMAGQQLWSQLQAKTIQCSQLTTTNFDNLGDYFMQQMMGDAHEAMEQSIIARSGQAGLDAMHVAMGERLSGCDLSVALPAGMMGYGNYYGASSTPEQYNTFFSHMMGYGYNGYGPMMGFGYASPWGGIFTALFWIIAVMVIIVLARRFGHGRHRGWCDYGRDHGAMDILKERYAKGEIDKKEFEDKKKDLES